VHGTLATGVWGLGGQPRQRTVAQQQCRWSPAAAERGHGEPESKEEGVRRRDGKATRGTSGLQLSFSLCRRQRAVALLLLAAPPLS
jgi:hypothetical protein